MRRPSRSFAASLVVAGAVAATACGGGPSPSPKPAVAPPPTASAAVAQPHQSEPAPVTPKDITLEILKKLAAHDFDGVSASFGPKMKEAVTRDQLAGVWSQVEAASGKFEGTSDLVEHSTTTNDVVVLTARFEKGQFEVTVALAKDSRAVEGLVMRPKIAHAFSPPNYADRAAFTEREITVGAAPWALPGTLTLPKGAKGKVPGVVLVHGSGPNDRDETIGGVKPFRDLAWGLASRGIAVLRYEKRTRAYAATLGAAAADLTTKDEVTDDAVLAARLLGGDAAVDAKRTFVLGHSMGATLAPRVVAAAPEIAGLVLVAGTTRPLEDIILEQHRYLLGLGAVPEEQSKAILEKLERQVQRVKDPKLSPDTPAADLPLGVGAKYWLDLRGYDPAAAAAALKKPTLVLWGARDFQVRQADFARYERAFAGRRDSVLRTLPGISHALTAAPPGAGPMSTPDEYEADANVDSLVVDTIARFVDPTKR